MPGTALVNFTDFVNATGPAYVRSATDFLNEAVRQSYLLGRFLKGRTADEVLQGGDTIKDLVMFDEANTYQKYQPNEELNWTQPQVTVEQELDWRFSLDQESWTDQEIELNMPSGMSRGYANVQYKKRKKIIEARMWTSMINGMDKDLMASPDSGANQMEANTGKEPLSIPAYITEDTTNYHSAGTGDGTWTTIMGIDPAAQSKWRNQVETYDYDDPDDSDGDADGLIDAFDNMITKVDFKAPGFHDEHFEPSYSGLREFIICSRGGLNQYKRLLRASNDTLVQKQDAAYNRPQFSGIDLIYATTMDTLSMVWGASGTAATETSFTTDGYRYYWVNANYLKPVYHVRRYFHKLAPFFLEKQPYTHVRPCDSWWNLFCGSRQRQGVVAPQ
jgi:hypothetical protein